MGYVTVQEESKEKLRLSREPSVRAWAICVGLISLGLGAAYYSADYLLWKLAYISGSVFVALSFMEDWEECVLDKSTGKVQVKTETVIHKLFHATHGQKMVTGDLNDVVDVSVEAEEVRYGANTYIVVLKFGAGYSMGITESATTGNKSDHQSVADKIYSFLELDKKPSSTTASEDPIPLPDEKEEEVLTEEEDLSDRGEDQEGEDSAHSDESFERIDRSDIPDDLGEAEAIASKPVAAPEAAMSQDVTSSTEVKAN